MGAQDIDRIIHEAAEGTKGKLAHHDDPSPAHMEVMQEMQAGSKEQQQLTTSFQSALKDGKISSVLQENIRQRILSSLSKDEQDLYRQETRQFGAHAAEKGPAHQLVERNVGQAEHMLLGQAIRQAGFGKINDIDHAIRVFQNPQGATKEDWIKLGLTVGSHGMLPPEISNKLSHSLALESSKFFSGSGSGSFADMERKLQANMKPLAQKVGTAAGDALETGKHAATGVGKWIKGKIHKDE